MRILVTATLEETGLERLRQLGEVSYEPLRETHALLAGDMLVEKLDGVHIFITEADQVSADVLEKTTTLQVVVTCRGWAVNVDIAAATEHGVLVLNTPGRNADAVADLTVCLMIMLARKVPQVMRVFAERLKEGNPMQLMWEVYYALQGSELWEKTVGIIGFGAVGQAVAKRLRGFGSRSIAFDPYVQQELFEQFEAHSVDLPTLLRESDYVTLHAKVTPETMGMLGAEQFALMKPTAYFLNLARAAMTDEDALAQALREKKIAGAALDVYQREPPPADHPLLQLDNVIALPHIGGNTAEVSSHQTRLLLPELERLFRGEKPQFCLNPELWPTFKLDEVSRPRQAIEEAVPLGGYASREALDAVVDKMVVLLKADEEVAKSIKDLAFSFAVEMSDLEARYYFAFRGGQVTGGVGDDPAGTALTLRMSSQTFDKLFSGDQDAMSLAVSGKVTFCGDTAGGTALMDVMGNIQTAYKAAKATAA